MNESKRETGRKGRRLRRLFGQGEKPAEKPGEREKAPGRASELWTILVQGHLQAIGKEADDDAGR